MLSWSSSSSSNAAMTDNDDYGDDNDGIMTTGKEDLSPTNSVNGYHHNSNSNGGVDSFGEAKKKKGPPPRQQEELCLVCGDRASGYHYNALTCEGCKGFFRRSITKNAVYQCKYGNNCEIDMYMRRKCQECRLKKCLSVGMRPECVVPEYQCAIKRESKRAQKEKDKPNSTTKGDFTMNHHVHPLPSSPDKDEKPCIRSIHASMNGTSGAGNNGIIHSSTTSPHHPLHNNHHLNNSSSNNHHNNSHHHNHNHHNSSSNNHHHNNNNLISSHHVDNSTSATTTTTTTTSLNNPMNNHTNGTSLNHHSSLTTLNNNNNNSIRSLNHNNNKILTSNDRIPNQGIKPLTPAQHETINKLVTFQEEFESPPEDDVKKITPFPLGESEEDSLKRFQHVTEMTILTVQLIVEFSKRVPGFDTLLREDQITLLKACSSEVMMLRCSRKYDIKTDSIVYANNQPYTRENYRSASIGEAADAVFNFCRMMCLLRVDNAEYSLLTAIVIFSERPALKQPQNIERIQEFYLETLRAYVENNRPPDKCYFAKLLSILTELRSLGNMNSEVCFSLKVQNKRLPPFLAEIWDIQE